MTFPGSHDKMTRLQATCGRGGIGRLGGFRFLWLSRAGSSPVARTKNRGTLQGCPYFWCGKSGRIRTNENATVQWTVATRRLDAGCSIVYSSPVARTREVIRTGNSGEVERIAVFADILLAFSDGLRYNDTELQLKSFLKILIA